MKLMQMIWNDINGPGAGSVALKGLFILVALALFWAFCELVKHLAGISVKLCSDTLRALAVKVRGEPPKEVYPRIKKETVPIYRVNSHSPDS
jgi:hypothetical protein